MKKTIFIGLIFAIANVLNAGQIITKLNIDLPITKSETLDQISGYNNYYENMYTAVGFGLGLEYLQHINNGNFNIGLGAEYQCSRTVLGLINGEIYAKDNIGTKQFSFLPIYATIEQYIAISSNSNINNTYKPFVKLNLGWNILYEGNDAFKTWVDGYGDNTYNYNMTGDLYYGAGIGMYINKNIKIDIMYSSYSGTRKNLVKCPLPGPVMTANKLMDYYTTIKLGFSYAFDINILLANEHNRRLKMIRGK